MMIKKIFANNNNIYKGYRLYDAKGDTSKKWFIYCTETKPRKKQYGNINKHHTPEGRYLAARNWIDELYDHKKYKGLTQTKKELLKALEARKAKMRWREKTYQTNSSKLGVFLDHVGYNEVSPETIEDFFEWLQINRHPTTYNNYYVVIYSILKEAKMDPEYFMRGIQKLRAQSTPYLFFSTNQHRRIKEAIKGTDLYYHVLFIYYSFIRPRSELTLLRESDIFLDKQRILMRGEVSKNKAQEFAVIPDVFVEDVREWLNIKPPSDWLFPSPRDSTKPISKDVFNRKHQKILKSLGIDTKIHKMYSWKHTGAYNFLTNGGTVLELSRLMRHRQIDTTMGYIKDIGADHLIGISGKFTKF